MLSCRGKVREHLVEEKKKRNLKIPFFFGFIVLEQNSF